jgi:hypothetical protein
MPLTIFLTLFVLSSPMAPSVEIAAPAPTAIAVDSRSEFVIPRARFLLHRWLEPSYQVRMLARLDWTRQNDDSTIF